MIFIGGLFIMTSALLFPIGLILIIKGITKDD